MANQNNNQNNNQNKKEILKIVVDRPEKFDNLVDSMYSTTQVLSKSINKLMSSVFEDYYGCVLTPNMQNPAAMDVALYFKPVSANNESDGRYRAFKPIGEKSSNNDSLMAKLAAIQHRTNTSDTFTMTQEAAELLNEFYPAWYNIKATPESYKKANAICEVADRQGYNMVPLCRVAGMDIVRLVSKIYGWKNEDGEAVEYAVQPVKPVSGMQPRPGDNASLNWIIAITRISKVQLDKLANEVGLVANNGLNIYTGM